MNDLLFIINFVGLILCVGLSLLLQKYKWSGLVINLLFIPLLITMIIEIKTNGLNPVLLGMMTVVTFCFVVGNYVTIKRTLRK